MSTLHDNHPVDPATRARRDPTRHPVTGVHCQWQETRGLVGRVMSITDRTGLMFARRVCGEPVVPGGYFCAEHQAGYDRDRAAGLHPGPVTAPVWVGMWLLARRRRRSKAEAEETVDTPTETQEVA